MVISICQQLLRAERAENPLKRRQQHHQGRAKEGQEKSPALEGLLKAGAEGVGHGVPSPFCGFGHWGNRYNHFHV